jgi:hypothetical protein
MSQSEVGIITQKEIVAFKDFVNNLFKQNRTGSYFISSINAYIDNNNLSIKLIRRGCILEYFANDICILRFVVFY